MALRAMLVPFALANGTTPMTPKLLIGQIVVVLAVVILGVWAATQCCAGHCHVGPV